MILSTYYNKKHDCEVDNVFIYLFKKDEIYDEDQALLS